MRQQESPFKIFHFQFINLLKCWVFLLINLYLGIWAHLICCWLDPSFFFFFFFSIGGTVNHFFFLWGGGIVAVRSKILSFYFFNKLFWKIVRCLPIKASLSLHPNFLQWLRLIIIVSYRTLFFDKLFHIGALCSYNIDILIFSFWLVYF